MWACKCVWVHAHRRTHSSSLGIICNNCSHNNLANRRKGQVNMEKKKRRNNRRVIEEERGKPIWQERKEKWEQRREAGIRCYLPPLVSAVASRMNETLRHRIGRHTLFLLSLVFISSFPEKPQGLSGGVVFLSNYTDSTVADRFIVPLQGESAHSSQKLRFTSHVSHGEQRWCSA